VVPRIGAVSVRSPVADEARQCAGRRRTVDAGKRVKEAAMARVRLRDILSPGDRAAVMGLRRGPAKTSTSTRWRRSSPRPARSSARCPRPGTGLSGDHVVGAVMCRRGCPGPVQEDRQHG